MSTKFLIGIAIVVLAIGALIFTSFGSTAMYYLTVSELKAKDSSIYQRDVRISGQLESGSINYDARNMILKFNLTDGSQKLPVVYNGVMPDTLEKSTEIVVEGRYTPEDVFKAHTLLVKCPSKYEPEEQGSQ